MLEENYSFTIELFGKMIRMVVSLSGVEKVCGLETRKRLEEFAWSDGNYFFTGRLQLAKTTPV